MEEKASTSNAGQEKVFSGGGYANVVDWKVKMAKFKTAIHKFVSPDKFDGKNWSYKTDLREVEVMAVADGYAMVRRKGCAPYICQAKEIKEKNGE